jgi:MYXO-CTERM domain-containing protein
MLTTRVVRLRRCSLGLSLVLASLAAAPGASAFPGFLAGKTKAPVVHSSQVVLMKKGPTSVVTVMPDYQGPLEPFVVVLATPADVVADHVVTLKREFIDHADQLSAPRFHEFWEQDPCDPGPPEQEWQRDLRVSGGGFLGGPAMGGQKKVALELSLDTQPKVKDGEYKMSVLAAGASPIAWLKEHGYAVPPGAEQAVAPYVSQGLVFVMAEVDTKRIELVGSDRAQLSPIRFFTDQPYDTLPSRLGLVNAPPDDKQELTVYALDTTNRYEVSNYENVTPPTNIEVDFEVKERMGEFYNSLYDTILKKHPTAFLREYAWPADGCGEPCATVPYELSELLSLGGDVFERSVPEDERNPKPPELSEDEKTLEKEILLPLKPKEKREKLKELKEDRQKIATVKALVQRHKYILSRLHYRYDQKTLAQDPKFVGKSDGLQGGTALPKGEKREASLEITSGEKNKLQTRFNNFHNWKPVIHCPGPDRYRWGKSPPDYKGLRKTWIAEDLTRKSRTQIPAVKMVKTDLPDLGLGPKHVVADAGADAAADGGDETDKKSGCGCRVQDDRAVRPGAWLTLLAGLSVFGWRRRRARD